ncbi:MAG: hypothetical protein CMP22_07975 [Rickettsiales bacterium]|nr:hypothetical protein [Rickettsiales bacterium]
MASGGFFDFAAKFEFNADIRIKFYNKLAQLMNNGVSLNVALHQIATTNKKSGSVLPDLYLKWKKQVTNGMNIGLCMGPYVPTSEAMLIETGANSGQLAKSFIDAADAVEQQGRVKKAIVSNGSYPVLLMCVLLAAMFLTSYEVIPTFESVLPVEEWQGASYAVAKAAFFFRDWSVVILGSIAILFTIIGFSLPRWTGKLRVKFDNFFPWNIYRMWQGSAFLLSVASLMSAGVKLDEVSLNRIARKADPYLAQRIRAVRKYIISGINFGEALHKTGYNFPDDELIADLRIYATLKGFENNLVNVTRDWVSDIEEKVTSSMKILNFVTLVLIAVVIGMLITALFGVVQQIQSSANT